MFCSFVLVFFHKVFLLHIHTYRKFIHRRKQSYSFTNIVNIVRLIKEIHLKINLHIVNEKSILVDVTNILNILLTGMTREILAKPL